MPNAFNPAETRTVSIDVSASSQRVAIGASPDSVRVMNNGTATVWIEFGNGSVTATTTTCMPVGPGVTEVLTSPLYTGDLYVAAIAAGATGRIYFTPGDGI